MFNTAEMLQVLPPDWIGAWVLEVVRVIGSLLLSALLVVLYWRMYRVQMGQSDVQQSQAAILDLQNKIMAASYTPDVVVEDVSVQGDNVEVRVSNRGRGRAKNFRICCQPYVRDSGGAYRPAWESEVSMRPTVRPLARWTDTGTTDSEFYRGVVELDPSKGDGSSVRFSEAISQIAECATGPEVGVELYVVYDSEIGERFVQRVECANDFDVGPESTLEEAIRTRASDDPIIETVS